MPLHTIVVAVHAAAATLALALGFVAFRAPGVIPLHSVSVVIMTATLIAAVALRHADRPAATTAVFGGLALIALVMCVQAVLAWRRRPSPAGGRPSAGCLRAVGFNCVGLVTGFVAVTATQLTSSALLISVVSLATVMVGRAILVRRVPA